MDEITKAEALQRCVELGITDIVQLEHNTSRTEVHGYVLLNGQLEWAYVFRSNSARRWDENQPVGNRWVGINLSEVKP